MRSGLPGQMEAMLDAQRAQLSALRVRYPLDDYAARVYQCAPCGSVDFAVAPAADLVGDYPCPECGAPQRPMTDVGEPMPPRPNRAARRRRKARR